MAGRSTIKRAKSFEVFLKYAGLHAKRVGLREESKIEESTDADGKKVLTPKTHFRLVAELPKHNVTLLYDELYVNRGKGFEDAAGEIVKPHVLKTRRLTIRAALEAKGLDIHEQRQV